MKSYSYVSKVGLATDFINPGVLQAQSSSYGKYVLNCSVVVDHALELFSGSVNGREVFRALYLGLSLTIWVVINYICVQ